MTGDVRTMPSAHSTVVAEEDCPDCRVSLFGEPMPCAMHQLLRAQRARAEASRAQKPEALARQRAREVARIEARLARAAQLRRHRRTLRLTTDDVWTGGVSPVYAMGEC